MIPWVFYPKHAKPTLLVDKIVHSFESVEEEISSAKHQLTSNQVLFKVAPKLAAVGFNTEKSQKRSDKIRVPVLFGRQGRPEKSFDADAYHPEDRFVLEVEAGRAVTNYQFLKDLFEACTMQEVDYLGIAVRRNYRGNEDFETVCTFFETLYASGRLQVPLKGILVLGY